MEQASLRAYDGFHDSDSKDLSEKEKLCWLRLLRSEQIGPITFFELIKQFGDAQSSIEALPKLSSKNKTIKIASERQAHGEILKAQKLGAELVAYGEKKYPPLLNKLDVPPPLIYIKGQFKLLCSPIISIVGARNGSAAGKKITQIIASELGNLGYVIASGLARGIDTEAHKASLENGTIGVVAGGIDVRYPPENSQLQEMIAEKGILIAENPPGFKPRGTDFPRRNRIISGISHAVIVIEAALKSGSLITARYALEQNREVFAVPGNPLDPRAAGTNQLIKRGANMLTKTDDVTEVLAPMLRDMEFYFKPAADNKVIKPASQMENPSLLDSDRKKILLALGPTPVDIDELIRCTGLSVAKVNMILLELDLDGRLERHGRQLVSLISAPDQGTLL